MSSYLSLGALILVCVIFPSHVLGRGGGDKGGGGVSGFGGLGGLGDATTVIFTFCVVFAFFALLQAAGALRNIYKRAFQQPPFITPPELSVGPIFPGQLLVSTLTLATFYGLDAAGWFLKDTQQISRPFFTTLNVFAYLPDIILVSRILALLAHREQVLVKTPPALHGTKMIFDVVLCVVLLALSTGFVGLSAVARTSTDVRAAGNFYVAYCAIFLATGVDVTVSSIILCIRAQRTPVNDRKVVLLIACVVSPFLLILAVYPIVLRGINFSEAVIASYKVNMASVIISCVIRFVIITMCLIFGRPPRRKKGSRY